MKMLRLFVGVLPLIASQHVDQCYGLDPSRFAVKTAMKTQERYRRILCR